MPIKKENNCKTSTYKIKFIDSFRFMSSSLSNLLDNLFKGLLNKKCGKCKSCLEYMSSEGIKLIFNA